MAAEAFGAAGSALWESLHDDDAPYSLTVLVIEVCRIADRLAKLHELLAGDTDCWVRLVEGRDDVTELRVDSALQEARQQASVLRQLLAEIARRRSPVTGGDDDPLDDL